MFGKFCYLTVIGTLCAILSFHNAVCDVDPSDLNSILMEQLKVHSEQLNNQARQLEIQEKQLKLLDSLNRRPVAESPLVTILVSVSCTVLGFVVLLFMRHLIKYLFQRYNIRPEMPQTADALCELELPDFPQYQARTRVTKSPADFSCEFDE